MKIQLRRDDTVKIKSWINDKPISTSDWEVFTANEGETEVVLLARDPNTGNQLKINITKYENFEEVENESGNGVPES